MPDNPAKEAFEDLLTYLERLETQTGALLQLLRDNGTVTDEKLAPYLEQASKASDVRMRAARARIEHLLSAEDTAKPSTEAVPAPSAERSAGKDKSEPPKPADNNKNKNKEDKQQEEKQKPAASAEKPQPSEAPEDSHEPSEIVSARQAAKDRPSSEHDQKADRNKEAEEKDAA